MPQVEVNNLMVDFPYEPYDIQKEYMSKIVECLQKKTNAVLESPTGTGKTLSLLCSSLAWLCARKAVYQIQNLNPAADSNSFLTNLDAKLQQQTGGGANAGAWGGGKLGPPKVVYASRTHSQLNQVMLELKKTAYRHVKVGVLGSRDQLCIHPKVSKESSVGAKLHMCKALVSSRSCQFYNNVENKIKEPLFREDILVDIEDLVKKGKQTMCCPYYASRELQHDVDILFTPYNYLLDAKTRRAQDIKLFNDVVILDEAHNVEKVCEESSSSQISNTAIAVCINEVTAVMKLFHNQVEQSNFSSETNLPKDFTAEDLALLKTLFMAIEKEIDNIPLVSNGDKKSQTFAGSHIFSVLKKAEITADNMHSLIELLNKVGQFLITASESQIHQQGAGLSKFVEFIEIVSFSLGQPRSTENTDRNFKLYVELEMPKTNSAGSSWSTSNAVESGGKVLHFWCFNPGFGMRSLRDQGVQSIILTSGTLSPLSATISEIGIPVHVQLSNPHIIGPDQICAVVVDKGPAGTELKCVYQNRTNQKYLTDLGQTCLNLYRAIPAGVLVFFPSYPFLKSCKECWQENGIWDRMAALKSIFVEPQNKDGLKPLIEEYYKTIEEKQGASLFAVCRGKVSEGLDFADSRARAVIVIGLPYPPFYDPKVVLKRAYMDDGRKQDSSKLDGNEWYQLEAMRAVNQAVGRVIRHADDHGAIIFCDCRFSFHSNVKSLSAWLQNYLAVNSSFGQAYKLVNNFFKNWKECPPERTLLKRDANTLQDSSQTTYRTIKPAQKLAPLSTASKSNDFAKIYAAITPISNADKEASAPAPAPNTKKKSLLETLSDGDFEYDTSVSSAEPQLTAQKIETPVCRENASTSTSFHFQRSKKRKLNLAPISFDNTSNKTTEVKFDLAKYTAKLQKALNPEQFTIFRTASKNYRETHDCRTYVSALSKLFLPNNDTQMLSLFRDIPFFLRSEEDKTIFWDLYYKLTRNPSKNI